MRYYLTALQTFHIQFSREQFALLNGDVNDVKTRGQETYTMVATVRDQTTLTSEAIGSVLNHTREIHKTLAERRNSSIRTYISPATLIC